MRARARNSCSSSASTACASSQDLRAPDKKALPGGRRKYIHVVKMERPAPDSQSADYAWDRVEPRRRAAYERRPAMKNVRFVGLDVHAQTIAVAVAEADGEVRS